MLKKSKNRRKIPKNDTILSSKKWVNESNCNIPSFC